MPKGNEHDDSRYIPRTWADALAQKTKESLDRRERTQAMLEPLRKDWLESDITYLKALNIKPF